MAPPDDTLAEFDRTHPSTYEAIVMIYRSGVRWSVPAILVALGLWGWAFGGIAGLMDAVIPINQVTHNTLWVPGHFHTYYLLGGLAFTFAYMYHLIRERSGTRVGRQPDGWHGFTGSAALASY